VATRDGHAAGELHLFNLDVAIAERDELFRRGCRGGGWMRCTSMRLEKALRSSSAPKTPPLK